MSEKQLVRTEAYHLSTWESYTPESLRAIAATLEERGIQSITLRLDYDNSYSQERSLSCYEERLETDEELKKRLDTEAAQRMVRENHERQQLEYLRIKYDKTQESPRKD